MKCFHLTDSPRLKDGRRLGSFSRRKDTNEMNFAQYEPRWQATSLLMFSTFQAFFSRPEINEHLIFNLI